MLVVEERGKLEHPEKNLQSWSKEKTNNKLNPPLISGPGIEPRPHWWKVSALTIAPPVFPKNDITGECILNFSIKKSHSKPSIPL